MYALTYIATNHGGASLNIASDISNGYQYGERTRQTGQVSLNHACNLTLVYSSKAIYG